MKRLPGASGLRDRLYGLPRGPDPASGTLRPVIYLPTWLQWDQMPQRPQFILEAFAGAGHDVWVIDPRLSESRTIGSTIHLVPSMAAVPSRNVILYLHFAPLVTLLDRFESGAVIYDLMDDLTIYDADEIGMPEERRVRHHHGDLMDRSDVVLVSNRVLGERHRNERPDLLRIENGVDVERFGRLGPVADQLQDRPGIVGYHGAIAQWFDFGTMAEIAERAPEITFVLVGPVDQRVRNYMDELLEHRNVEHIPEQPGELIPSFVRGFDVGLIPFVVDEMTEGVTPLKMYEYLISGIPVVASPLPACLDHPGVATGRDAAEFVEEIGKALSIGDVDRQRLIGYGKEASWDHRLEPLLERLDELHLRRVP